MEVGLFLDVDGVLTEKPVNLQYAQLLKVESKLRRLERRWADGAIRNAQFNRSFIPIFRKAQFTLSYARKKYPDIQMREDARDLLTASADTTFIVTSGPSYFVDRLAKEYRIPKDRVVCSQYEFDGDGLIKSCISPSTSRKKAAFVKEHAKKFDVSIGVGDTEQDIEFLSFCTVSIMTSRHHHGYLTVTQLQPIIDLVHQFQNAADVKLAVRHLIKDDALRARCEDILHGRADFDRAINHATLVLEDRIRRKAKASESTIGERLVDFAYNEQLTETRLRVRSKKPSDQRGFTRLIKGVVPVFRNVTHHQIINVSREEAVRIAAFIDLLLRVVDDSVKVK